MKVSEVSKLSPVERFLYWIEERHSIYLKRQRGEPKPWTDDEILQRYFFTNPFRENDKTTEWFRENVRGPLSGEESVLLATIIFRWFNYIPTGEVLISGNRSVYGLLTKWDSDTAKRILRNRSKIFTGAFMINSPPGVSKLDAICERIDNVWKDRGALYAKAREWESLQEAHEDLMEYPGLGGFMAYEVVCDLRWTYLLESAEDIMTWCNPGPGCIRGLYRISGTEIENKSNSTSPPKPKHWRYTMAHLLSVVQRRMPEFVEMREIEHSLCEFDKYERARTSDGRMKRKYSGAK